MKTLRNLSAMICMSAAFAVTASAAEVVPAENRACTRDYNAWGNASQCTCPSEAMYDQRSAYCLRGELEAFSSEGFVSTGIAAVGGETTGVVFESSEQDLYELILPLRLKAQLAESNTGTVYRIYGDYIEVPGVESGPRPTIIVNQLIPVN